MDLATAFTFSVARAPHAIAICDGAERRSYAAWDAEIRAVAGGLRSLGLGAGDHFVTVLSNRCEMATLYWACQMIGAIFTPFNWRASAEEIAFVLADAEAKLVAFEGKTEAATAAACATTGLAMDRLLAVADGTGGGAHFAQIATAPAVSGPIAIEDSAIALMLYTSGTTGRPKGVPRSHAAERNAALACIAQLGLRHGECQLGVMPLFHTMGQRTLLMAMMLNGKFVCMPAFDAEGVLRLIALEKITALFLVPTMFHDIVHHPRFAEHDLATVRNLGYAGMSMSSALTLKCAEAFQPQSFVNYYGSSEIYSFTVCDHVIAKPGSAGRAAINQQIRIVNADPEARTSPDDLVAPGEAGEIIATMRSPDAFRGYWKRPDADEKAIRDGWYFTGDLGQWDADGELTIVGRVDDMIISGGENIYPEEVEDVLAKSGLVRHVAAIGLPDERWGQKLVAFVEPARPEVTAEMLDRACLKSALARFKRPRGYGFVAEIPRSGSGKLLRRFLREGRYTLLPGFKSTL
ncbi:MAG: long-chain fatty acid--CoA ligase [Rhodospirillales bacterium]|nr:long-chain fatty acid--CoA ligase [Rhodospirillales bacterium]